MPEAFHHGPEIIERFEGTAIVVDVKAATTFIIGSAPIHLTTPLAADRAKLIDEPLIVRRRSDAAVLGPSTAGYTLPQAIASHFAKDRGQGVGTMVVVNVFNPDVHKTGATPDPATIPASAIIGGVTLAGKPKGLEIAYACFNRLGFFPRRIIAPGFTEIAAIRAALSVVANRIHGHTLFDLPLGATKQQVVEARGTMGAYNVSSERIGLCYPRVLALDPDLGAITMQPLSQHLAGVWSEAIVTDGVQYSPSNRVMPDVSGTETDIYFYPSDTTSDTDLLNAAGLTTVMNMYGSGFRTWGNRSAAYPLESKPTGFFHARTVMDVLHEAILYYALGWVDKPVTATSIEQTEDRVSAYLHQKEGDGWIYGSRFRLPRDKNTPEQIGAEGRIYYKLETAPIGVAERITIESYIDLGLIRSALNLT